MTLRLTHDRVLIVLPPATPDAVTPSGLVTAPALPPPVTHGKVWKAGPDVRDVAPGDMVAFPPTAGDPVDIRGHACLVIRERDIVAIIERDEVLSA